MITCLFVLVTKEHRGERAIASLLNLFKKNPHPKTLKFQGKKCTSKMIEIGNSGTREIT